MLDSCGKPLRDHYGYLLAEEYEVVQIEAGGEVLDCWVSKRVSKNFTKFTGWREPTQQEILAFAEKYRVLRRNHNTDLPPPSFAIRPHDLYGTPDV